MDACPPTALRLRLSMCARRFQDLDRSLDMPIDDRAKEQDQTPTNVRQFIPRESSSSPKADQRPGSRAKQVGTVDNDDDPGPSVA